VADRTHSNSPPLVTSKLSSLQSSSFNSQNPSGTDLQNFLGSPNSSKKKEKHGFQLGESEGKILSSPKDPKSSKKSDIEVKAAD